MKDTTADKGPDAADARAMGAFQAFLENRRTAAQIVADRRALHAMRHKITERAIRDKIVACSESPLRELMDHNDRSCELKEQACNCYHLEDECLPPSRVTKDTVEEFCERFTLEV